MFLYCEIHDPEEKNLVSDPISFDKDFFKFFKSSRFVVSNFQENLFQINDLRRDSYVWIFDGEKVVFLKDNKIITLVFQNDNDLKIFFCI